MAIIKCKMCGGDLNLVEGASTAECEYCGSVQTIPKVDDEKKLTLFARANRLRIGCEFDKAAGIYESIVADFPEEAEAYWGLVLCKYGIEYVDDPATGKKIPTCHRSSFESIMDDSDFEQAVENADGAARKVYRDEAKAIEEIRKGIIAVSANEEPYDIFICYKETAENGDRTLDSVLAQDVYDALTDKGYRVFFSRISLEDKLGVEYEPYIFAALNSAKIMLAFGTDYEYFNAVWVKNEWSRFLKLMAKDKEKHLIPCYKGIDAYDMPKEFAKLQAQDLGKVGAMQDLLRGIEKIMPHNTEPQQQVVQQSASNNNPTIESYIKRAFMFLEDGDWRSANEYCEKVLDIDPENAMAYVGKLMAELRVKKQANLKDQAKPFNGNANYQKVIRFADESLKATMEGYITHINTRNENARQEDLYTKAKNEMLKARSESAYKQAAWRFEQIKGYKDSDNLAKECYEKAEIARKDAVLSVAKSKMVGAKIFDYQEAKKLLTTILGWKNADELMDTCDKKIAEIQEKEEVARQERKRREEQQRQKSARIKKITTFSVIAVCAVTAFVFVLINVIIPTSKYNNAIALMDSGEYDKAYSLFQELGDYKDSDYQSGRIHLLKVKEQLKNAQIGEYVTFGRYEQDDNTSNGQENIEWLVLDIQDGKALVISKYVLDAQRYNETTENVTWETCTLRTWLNNDFLNAAFSTAEQEVIPTVTIIPDEDTEVNKEPGNATQDKVFLIGGVTEQKKYFDNDEARRCKATACTSWMADQQWNCAWWTRSVGYGNVWGYDPSIGLYHQYEHVAYDRSRCVADTGVVTEIGRDVSVTRGVRPMLWIDLSLLP